MLVIITFEKYYRNIIIYKVQCHSSDYTMNMNIITELATII